jgi:hypothetical protein
MHRRALHKLKKWSTSEGSSAAKKIKALDLFWVRIEPLSFSFSVFCFFGDPPKLSLQGGFL